jgi:hypothetical protein
MRFLAAVVFVAMMLVMAVSAAPKNVPSYDPQAAAEFNSQQQTGKRSLQDAVHQWLNPDKVRSHPSSSLAPLRRYIVASHSAVCSVSSLQ